MTNRSLSPKALKVTLALLAAEVLAMIEITMIYAAMRHLVEDFGSPQAVGWTITGFLLASAVSAALFGRLGDMVDRKRLLLLVMALSIGGSLIAGSFATLAGVIAGRTIQGFAGAIFPLCIGILRENIDSHALPMFVGVLSGVMTVSAGLGLLFGGVIVDHLSWRWIFFTTALVGGIAWICVYLMVPTALVGGIAWICVYLMVPSGRPGRIERDTNFIGGLLFAPGVACLLLVLAKGRQWGWAETQTLTLLATGALLLVAWIRSELRASKPLLDIRLLLDRDMLLAIIATILFALSWMQFAQVWSLLLQQSPETGAGLGLSASAAGLIMQPQTFVALIGGPLAGLCVIRLGTRASFAAGGLVLAAAWVIAIFKHDTIAFVVLLMVIMGLSSSFLVALTVTAVAQAAPRHRTSEAIGIMTLIRTLANSVGAIIVFYLLGTSTVPGPDGRGQFPDASAYALTMSYIAIGLALIAVLYVAFHKATPDARDRRAPGATTAKMPRA